MSTWRRGGRAGGKGVSAIDTLGDEGVQQAATSVAGAEGLFADGWCSHRWIWRRSCSTTWWLRKAVEVEPGVYRRPDRGEAGRTARREARKRHIPAAVTVDDLAVVTNTLATDVGSFIDGHAEHLRRLHHELVAPRLEAGGEWDGAVVATGFDKVIDRLWTEAERLEVLVSTLSLWGADGAEAVQS